MAEKQYCYMCGKKIKQNNQQQPIDIVVNNQHIRNVCESCRSKKISINKTKTKTKYL